MKFVLAIPVIALAAAACDSGGGSSSTSSAPRQAAAPAKSAAEIAAEERQAALDAERARLSAGMTTPFASQEEWVAGCIGAGIDETICTCTVEKAVEHVGEEGLYTWVWEGYVAGDGTARMRSNKYFADAGISKEGQQAFADDVGTCYTY